MPPSIWECDNGSLTVTQSTLNFCGYLVAMVCIKIRFHRLIIRRSTLPAERESINTEWMLQGESGKQGRPESRESPGKSFHVRSAQKYSRRGQLNNGVWHTFKVFVHANRESITDYSTQAFTVSSHDLVGSCSIGSSFSGSWLRESWSRGPNSRSLIESRQCNVKQKKRISMKMQLRKVKIMKIKSSWGPLKVWGPRESIPPPFGGPAGNEWGNSLVNRNSQRYHYLRVCIRAMDHQGMVKTSLSFLQSWGDRFEVCSLLLCQNTLDRVHVWECGSCNWQGHPLPVPPRRLHMHKEKSYAASWLVHKRKWTCEGIFVIYFKLSSGLLA